MRNVLCRSAFALIVLGGSALATAPVRAGGYYAGSDLVAPPRGGCRSLSAGGDRGAGSSGRAACRRLCRSLRGIGSGRPRSRVRLWTARGTGD